MADNDTQKEIDELKKQKEKLETEKAVVDARKALIDSQNQAILSKYLGDVKAGPYSGTVTMKDKAGTEEALLLAAKAVNEAACRVVEVVSSKATTFYIFSSKSFPNFQRLIGFQFREQLIKRAFAAVGIEKTEKIAAEAVTAGLVSAGLQAFSDILGFFKTDYEIGNIDTQLDESLLLFSVAGCLAQKAGMDVHLPMVYDPNTESSCLVALANQLRELVDLRTRASSQVDELKKQLDEAEKAAAEQQNAASKDALLKDAADLKLKIDRFNSAIALYDAFANSLTTPDSTTGAPPLASIAQELAIDSALRAGGAVLLLRLENTGGGYLLKKNLLTGLFTIPLYHMGGATVSYMLLDGKPSKVLAGGVIPIYGGFVKTSELRNELQNAQRDN